MQDIHNTRLFFKSLSLIYANSKTLVHSQILFWIVRLLVVLRWYSMRCWLLLDNLVLVEAQHWMTGVRLAQWEPCCVSALCASCCVCLWLKRAIACQPWHPVLHHHTADCHRASTCIHAIILHAPEPVQNSSSCSTFALTHPQQRAACYH